MSFVRQLLVLVLLVVALAYFKDDFVKAKDNISSFFAKTAPAVQDSLVGAIKKEIFTPPPLRTGTGSTGANQAESDTLTASGVVVLTNKERTTDGAGTLQINAKLTEAAQIKMKDMFDKQYFEHVSPTGKGPADLSEAVGYEYIVIGENLAEGGFENNAALVTAWMNSPGHRANILNKRFTEIGVAVGQGEFEGHTVWMAVQEFGEPLSDCPTISESLKASIDSLKNKIANLDDDLKAKKAELDKTSQSDPSYNTKARAYNDEVNQYNADLSEVKSEIDQYNQQVQRFNACSQG